MDLTERKKRLAHRGAMVAALLCGVVTVIDNKGIVPGRFPDNARSMGQEFELAEGVGFEPTDP